MTATPSQLARLAGLAAILLLLHCVRELDSDEGLILHGAWSILNGRTPYTDFFEFVAPGSFYLVASAWFLTGESYWTAKFIGISAIGAAAWAVYATGKLICQEARVSVRPASLMYGPGLLILFSATWPAINHNTFHVALAAWGTFFMTRAIQKRAIKDAAIAGALIGVSMLVLQHKGAALAATVLLVSAACAVLHRDWRGRGLCAAIFGASAMLAVSVPLLFWPASVLYEDLILFPATHYLEVNRTSFNVFVLVGVLLAAVCWQLRNARLDSVRLLLCLQAILFLMALQRTDLSHTTQSLFPLLSLAPLWLVPPSSRSRWVAAVCTWGLLTLALPPAAIRTAYVLHAGVTGQQPDPALEYLSANCRSPYIYAGPFEPGLYFEFRKLNPTRHSFLLTGMNTATHFEQAVADLEVHRPPCAVLNRGKVEKFRYQPDNAVESFIASNYALAVKSRDYEVWRERASLNSDATAEVTSWQRVRAD